MKDPEFIELLNLYLDHEISRADAARLEAEVQSNPQRRRVYQEYCRMQKACVLLAQQAEPVAELDQRNVVAFEPSRSWNFGTYAAGLCAAAACLALVFVARSRIESTSRQNQANAPVSQPAATVAPLVQNEATQARTISHTVSVTPRSSELKPVFTTHAFALSSNESRTENILPSADARFDWMNRVQVSSVTRIPAEELLFETKAMQTPDSRTFRSRQAIDAQIERTAFQFQR